MAQKKSLLEAVERARELSTAHPQTTYYVMDRPRKRAEVHAVEWIYRELVLEGWHCYCKFRDGKRI